jgi:hypothetical protein
MASIYRKFMRFQLLHSYYGVDAVTPDFVIKPTPRTAQLLRNYGLTFRNDPFGFRLLYAAYESDIPVAVPVPGGPTHEILPLHALEDMPDGESLDFILELKNTQFLHFTELPGLTTLRNQILVLDSLDRSSAAHDDFYGTLRYTMRYTLVPPTSYAMRPSIFSHTYTLVGNPYKGQLRVKDADGAVVWEAESIRTEDDVYHAKVNLSAQDPGIYTLEKLASGVVQGTPEAFYLDDAIAPNSTFAVVRLRKETLWETLQTDNASNPDEELGMVVQFDHREAQWKYKVVFKFSVMGDANDYRIVDGLSTVTSDDRYNTGNTGDQFFFLADGAATKFNGYDAIVFKSVDALDANKNYPLYSEPKFDINLQKSDGGSFSTFVSNLPKPGTKSYVPEVIIYV